ncbi:MAG: recombinase family protein [Xanthobacteraceae bacterium]|nr:MAG: recombinase family protein [Xanthobacteraceae bacterium]
MASKPPASVRCAIYTRKSTEHGLELEFNSLAAQREACEAYVKSQASLGWKVLPKPYDDPAYSGGNLDRPALQELLKDIDGGFVDVIVVYKIDRLTRSLADFAKLVEVFDAKAISFVAVTQQFNTTTSMGRLTLNVLLSFAQFERELSSERVRDKIAASRRKGKWTGGTVPLGYDARNKKLVINKSEAETVHTIFRRYLELKSFAKLVVDLDAKGIVTKRRNAKVKKYQGGIPFTYGPLAHLLKNRIYVGEISHAKTWYLGEHAPILDREIFDQVQALLAANVTERTKRRTASGALLLGKLYDDRGNHMSPSYSAKKGIRYRFYVSSALLRGRRKDAGSITRIAASQIENLIEEFLTSKLNATSDTLRHCLAQSIEQVTLFKNRARLTLTEIAATQAGIDQTIDLPLVIPSPRHQPVDQQQLAQINPKHITEIVRAHAWLAMLSDSTFETIDDLACAVKLHPKVVRENLKMAFLAPSLIEHAITGRYAV